MTKRTALYLAVSLLAGTATATAQGFSVGSGHWAAASLGGPVFGLALGNAIRMVRNTDPWRWALVGAVATFAVTLVGARCAMCFFVGQ